MNILELETKVRIYENVEELDKQEQLLINEANKALEIAYAPYSKFKVGAALLLDNGEIDTGSNQENASFPIGLCAERVALANKAANHPEQKIKAVAVSVDNGVAQSLASPCGMCRQALYEAESRQGSPIKILLKSPSGEVYVVDSVEALLPLPFSSKSL